jgi:hypothetical protein
MTRRNWTRGQSIELVVSHQSAKSATLEYPWQEVVLAAFAAPPDSLPAKARAAERAIADRLKDQPQPDSYEISALTDALNALSVLMREAIQEQQRREQDTA